MIDHDRIFPLDCHNCGDRFVSELKVPCGITGLDVVFCGEDCAEEYIFDLNEVELFEKEQLKNKEKQ